MEEAAAAAFDCSPHPAACRPDWMSALPDALPLSRLSVPGTHDSLSLFGSRRLRCQSWGLEAQLAAGVRFLDVRCKLERGQLLVYHLCAFQRASLAGVLRRTLRFLRAHPAEAVLVRIKEEAPLPARAGFAARLRRHLAEEGEGRVWCREEVPTLGQVRGKIVVLEELRHHVLGIPYQRLSVGDAWNVLSLARKGAQVREHLEAAAGGQPGTLHLTFCSGNGLFTCPAEVARFVNPRCHAHLQRRAGRPARWGVVIMDFPGADLIRLIVESNAVPAAVPRPPAVPTAPMQSGHPCTGPLVPMGGCPRSAGALLAPVWQEGFACPQRDVHPGLPRACGGHAGDIGPRTRGCDSADLILGQPDRSGARDTPAFWNWDCPKNQNCEKEAISAAQRDARQWGDSVKRSSLAWHPGGAQV